MLLLAGCADVAPAKRTAPSGYRFPELTGRVVDVADLLPASDEVAILPAFRAKDFPRGVSAGVDGIINEIGTPQRKAA